MDHDDLLRQFQESFREDVENDQVETVVDYINRFPAISNEIARAFVDWQKSRDRQEDSIGPYKIIRQIGRGGQAIVYLCRDEQLERNVAVKVLLGLGGASVESVERFRREALITSKLDHPGICPLYDTGLHEGAPWIAMRYVEGRALSAIVADSQGDEDTFQSGSMMIDLSQITDDTTAEAENETPASDSKTSVVDKEQLNRAIAIVEKVARTLHVAHEAGIVHRDVKPGNIIVTNDGQPVLLDFGLASFDQSIGPGVTRSGEIMGTPAYMSPEQIAVGTTTIDRRADVWALGVMLYELTCLSRPFEAPSRDKLYRQILNATPTPLHKVNPAVNRDLSIVVETAMAKNPDERYLTAMEMAQDLERIRKLEPIAARPASVFLKVKRWSQRNPALAVSVAILIVVITASVVTLLSKNTQLGAANQDLLREEKVARDALEDSRQHQYVSTLAGAAAALALQDNQAAIDILGRSPEAKRGWEWNHLMLSADSSLKILDRGDENRAFDISFNAEGSEVSVTSVSGLRTWSTTDWSLQRETVFEVSEDGKVDKRAHSDFVFNSQGTQAATIGLTHLHRINVADGKPITELKRNMMRFQKTIGCLNNGRVVSPMAAFNKNLGGRWLQTSAVETGADPIKTEYPDTLALNDPHRLAIDDSERYVAILDVRGHVCIGNLEKSGKFTDFEMLRKNQGEDKGMTRSGNGAYWMARPAFSPAGEFLATAHFTRSVDLWMTAQKRHRFSLNKDLGPPTALAFSPDGNLLAAAYPDLVIRLWDLNTKEIRLNIHGHTAIVSCLEFSNDGALLASASFDGSMRIWTTSEVSADPVVYKHKSSIAWLRLDPNNGHILAGTHHGELLQGNAENGAGFEKDQTPPRSWMWRGYPGDKFVFAQNEQGPVEIISPVDGSVVRKLEVFDEAATAHQMKLFSLCTIAVNSGRSLLATGAYQTVRIWNTTTGAMISELERFEGVASHLTLSNDGSKLLVHSVSGASIHEVQSGEKLKDYSTKSGIITAAAPWPGKRRIAVASSWGSLGFVDLDALDVTWITEPKPTIITHSLMQNQGNAQPGSLGSMTESLLFSPRGRFLASKPAQGVGLQIWDAQREKLFHSLVGHKGKLRDITWFHDESRLVTASNDGSLRIWDPHTGDLLLQRNLGAGAIASVAVTPDDKRIIIGCQDGTIRFLESDVFQASSRTR